MRTKVAIAHSAQTAADSADFWGSQIIARHLALADRYASQAVGQAITDWERVQDVTLLAPIVDDMQQLESDLGLSLARKARLDVLAKDLGEAVDFCRRFKGVSIEEKQK